MYSIINPFPSQLRMSMLENVFVFYLTNSITRLMVSLKVCSTKLLYEICTSIFLIFTRFLEEDFCQDIWKISYIILKFKKGDPSLPVHGRPIIIGIYIIIT